MSATPHNLGAIDAMGQQFKYNVFDKAPGKLLDVHKKNVMAAKRQAAMTAASRNAYAQSAQNVVNQGRKNFAQNQANMAKKAQAAQKAHATAVKKGTAAPSPGAQPRVFAMPAGPQGVQQRVQQKAAATAQAQQAKAQASQVNNAHGEALKEAADRIKTMRSQVNFAHGEAHKENNRRTKEAQKGAAPTPTKKASATVAPTPQLPGGPMQRAGSSPVPKAAQGSQFVDVQARDNSPFPTHQHPEGSSNLKLGNLSANQPKPNDFTVGSRNVKPGGIAAKGSQLEAWAISKSQAVQARQASRKAGGRDKELAAEAKKKENFANQPLKNFAP